MCVCVCVCVSLSHSHTHIDTHFLIWTHTDITNHVSCDCRAALFSEGEKSHFLLLSDVCSLYVCSHMLHNFFFKFMVGLLVSVERSIYENRQGIFANSLCRAICFSSSERWKPSVTRCFMSFTTLNLLFVTYISTYLLWQKRNPIYFRCAPNYHFHFW